jgi:hypothetical protein
MDFLPFWDMFCIMMMITVVYDWEDVKSTNLGIRHAFAFNLSKNPFARFALEFQQWTAS